MRLSAIILLGLCFSGLALAEAPKEPLKTVKLRNTYYYVMLESEFRSFPVDSDILSMDGKVLARVSHQFKKRVDIEGTGRLRDGRVINYKGRVNGQIRYWLSDSNYGYGVGTCKLEPFRSIAVDPSVVPLGSLVYIAETDGMTLPDGKKHDGYWRADDIGSAILKDRVDLFIGDSDNEGVTQKNGIHNLQALTVMVVKGPEAGSCVDQTLAP
jgi:3D (Asp-Asp-Asp) domain-containing protein